MAWFPVFVDLEGRRCLVAGGGKLALHKAEKLLSFGAGVRVVAPEILPRLRELPVECLERKVVPSDIEGMTLVVDATGRPEVGEMLAAACAAKRIPLNVVDNKPLCSFLFPAICQCGPLTAGVSTGGASPLAAAWARDQLVQALPDRFDQLLEQMDQLRGQAKRRIPDQRDRGAFLKRCFTRAMEQGGPLSEQELDELWEERS